MLWENGGWNFFVELTSPEGFKSAGNLSVLFFKFFPGGRSVPSGEDYYFIVCAKPFFLRR